MTYEGEALKKQKVAKVVAEAKDLAALHQEYSEIDAEIDALNSTLKVRKAKRDLLEEEVLRLLAIQREQGLAPTARMTDGTVYTEVHRTPWDGVDHGKVLAALAKLGHLEFAGKPKYGEMRTEWAELKAVPTGLRKLLVVRDIPYLSVTRKS